METSFQATLAEQREAMQRLTRIMPNLKKSGEANITYPVVQRRIEQVRELKAEVDARHYRLITLATDQIRKNCDYFTADLFDDCEDSTNQLLDQLDARLVKLTPTGETKNNLHSSSVANIDRPTIKLPTIDLPRFDGAYTQWQHFSSRFSTLVIKNPRLTDFERLHYLHTALQGSAARAIAHLDVVDENFPKAWDLLQTRFEHPRRIAFAHLDTLFALPTMRPNSSESLRALRDDLMVTKISLSRVIPDVEHWDALFVYMSVKRLDNDSRANWELEIGSTKDVPTFQQLERFLDNRIHFLASIVPVSAERTPAAAKRTIALPNISTHSTQAVQPSCVVCKQNHLLHRCSAFRSYSVPLRKQTVSNKNLCFNCLQAHFVSHCPSSYRCRKCGDKHHTLLHPAQQSSAGDKPDSSSSRAGSADPVVASHQASRGHVPRQGGVLLATARVKVHSPTGRSAVFRALLDQGSEATLISENLAQLLRLPRTKRTTLITGIGGAHSTAHYSAPIQIGPAASGVPLESTVAIILNSLTGFIPTRGVLRGTWQH